MGLFLWLLWAYTAPQQQDGLSATTTPDGGLISGTDDEEDVAQLLLDFGDTLQDVSLLEPAASSTIERAYGPYVVPTLLARWVSDPEAAPGRTTSSPWPDHIEITSVTQGGDDYTVLGNIIMMTSAGEAGSVPFTATVTQADDDWLISAFTQSAASSGM